MLSRNFDLENERSLEWEYASQRTKFFIGKISVDSPIGKGLLGKEVGDVAEVIVPNGTMKFDVLEITRV